MGFALEQDGGEPHAIGVLGGRRGVSRPEMRCEGGAPEWIAQSLVKNIS